MGFGMEAGIFLAYTAGLLAVYFFGRLLLVPVRIIMKLLASSLIGGLVLAMLNLLCINFEIFFPVNPLTAGIAGLLGIPGIIGILIFFNAASLF